MTFSDDVFYLILISVTALEGLRSLEYGEKQSACLQFSAAHEGACRGRRGGCALRGS